MGRSLDEFQTVAMAKIAPSGHLLELVSRMGREKAMEALQKQSEGASEAGFAKWVAIPCEAAADLLAELESDEPGASLAARERARALDLSQEKPEATQSQDSPFWTAPARRSSRRRRFDGSRM